MPSIAQMSSNPHWVLSTQWLTPVLVNTILHTLATSYFSVYLSPNSLHEVVVTAMMVRVGKTDCRSLHHGQLIMITSRSKDTRITRAASLSSMNILLYVCLSLFGKRQYAIGNVWP